ncbi:hypothetical protein C8J57DRAFT_1634023 [Mycena rebaudengoi]|nr:hypothetical protein C8J57DRAFT_1107426 [Mycena rebaudengoi]KAJ7197498.1 hypothetical protein C8J57DRAFT_1105703 [Mycena rebaudengoi]KAJ7199275.1 hypothetical protein C8J57DRAFT_1634023 [Mycena rebaudengoi]
MTNYLPIEEHNAVFQLTSTPSIQGQPKPPEKEAGEEYFINRINDVLRLFVPDPRLLLRILSTTRSVISGSVPLTVICGGIFVPADLDIYVPASQEETLLLLLEDHFGFKDLASYPATDYENNCEVDTARRLHSSEQVRTINVMTCAGESAIQPIFNFHSTLVMNFISSQGLYCAYPLLTTSRAAIPATANGGARPSASAVAKCLEKYLRRGFSFGSSLDECIDDLPAHTCYEDSSCPRTIRTLYDGRGAFLSYENPDRPGRVDPDILYDNVHTAIWSIGGAACGNHKIFHGAIAFSDQIRKVKCFLLLNHILIHLMKQLTPVKRT